MKKFNLKKAKKGAPVITSDGVKARIICFDKKGDYPLVVLLPDTRDGREAVHFYLKDGRASNLSRASDYLLMAPQPKKKKKTIGWVNVYKTHIGEIWFGEARVSKKDVKSNEMKDCIKTVKIRI